MPVGAIPVLDKSLMLLEFLGTLENGATQAQMVENTGMSTATCYRAIQTFLRHNWVQKNADGAYSLSYGLAAVADKLTRRIQKFNLIQPVLDGLSAKTGLSVKLSIRHGLAEFMTLLRADADSPIALFSKIGSRFPIIEGSVGAVFLQHATEAEVSRLLKAAADAAYEKNNPDVLRSRIRECREKGYCFYGSHNRKHTETLSAPLMSERGMAVLSLLGFPEDFEGREQQYAKAMLEAVSEGERILQIEEERIRQAGLAAQK